jgi:hypothetical protein
LTSSWFTRADLVLCLRSCRRQLSLCCFVLLALPAVSCSFCRWISGCFLLCRVRAHQSSGDPRSSVQPDSLSQSSVRFFRPESEACAVREFYPSSALFLPRLAVRPGASIRSRLTRTGCLFTRVPPHARPAGCGQGWASAVATLSCDRLPLSPTSRPSTFQACLCFRFRSDFASISFVWNGCR